MSLLQWKVSIILLFILTGCTSVPEVDRSIPPPVSHYLDVSHFDYHLSYFDYSEDGQDFILGYKRQHPSMETMSLRVIDLGWNSEIDHRNIVWRYNHWVIGSILKEQEYLNFSQPELIDEQLYSTKRGIVRSSIWTGFDGNIAKIGFVYVTEHSDRLLIVVVQKPDNEVNRNVKLANDMVYGFLSQVRNQSKHFEPVQ